jgi:hypothetical protein
MAAAVLATGAKCADLRDHAAKIVADITAPTEATATATLVVGHANPSHRYSWYDGKRSQRQRTPNNSATLDTCSNWLPGLTRIQQGMAWRKRTLTMSMPIDVMLRVQPDSQSSRGRPACEVRANGNGAQPSRSDGASPGTDTSGVRTGSRFRRPLPLPFRRM